MLSTIELSEGKAPWYEFSTNVENSEQKDTTIHFSSANGFPVASYQQFYQAFAHSHNFTAMDSRGAWRGTSPPNKKFSQMDFAQDLIAGLKVKHSHAVIGMGHSHGGLLTVMAAYHEPSLFSKLVIIEPASAPPNLFGRIYPHLPQWLLWRLVPIIKGSHERQRIWPSRDAFFTRYHGHRTFKHFNDQALKDYTQHGLRKRDDGQFELVFQPEWESHIFSTVPIIWDHLSKIAHPTLFIRAEHSYLYSASQFAKQNQPLGDNITTVTMKNAHHLAPLEKPTEVAKIIQQWLNQ